MESATDNDQQIRMLPPPPRTFKDREELIGYVSDFAANHGYVVSIKNSKRDSEVYLSCNRGGTTRKRSIGEPKRKRKTPSRLINCPFEAVGRKDDDVWILRIKNGDHNHGPLKDMSEHPYNRRFSEDEVRQIKEMVAAGLKPREMLETLKQSNPDIQSTTRDVYNLKVKISQGKFSETSFKFWKPIGGASSNRTNPLKVSNFIGGKFVDSVGNVFADVVNPAIQEVVSQVPSATYEEVKSAVYAAQQALRSWRNTPLSVRQRVMIKLSELIRRDIDKLALIISTEQGETIKRAHASILHSLEVVEHACGNKALQMGEFVPNASTGINMQSIREPLGVCAGICEFNYPAVVPLWMFPISIICGNTFVLKPSEKSPGTSLKLAELAIEAGVPDGVLNIVHGGNDIVDYICGDDDIQAISFVGSYGTATRIYAQAAARGKRVEVNIRSKNQAVVMPDASMDSTLDALVAAGFGGPGDPFMSLRSFIFVGRSAPWVEELVKRATELKVYEGTDETADIGPVISQEVKAKICGSVQYAVEGGATLILDGRNIMVPVCEKGSFVGPTILSGITPSMDWFEEDLSVPLVLCTQVNNLEEAIAIVNQQKFKSGASIFTTSGFSAKKFQNEVEARLVGINVPVSIPLPFSSTNLHFHGKAGVQFYTQVKSVTQQWRGLTSKRISSAETSIPESNLIQQEIPMGIPVPFVLSSHESSSSMCETSDRGMTGQENPVIRPLSDDPSRIISMDSSHSTPALQKSVPSFISLRTDIPAPLDNGSLQSYLPTTTNHTLQIVDAIPTGQLNMPSLSHRYEDIRAISLSQGSSSQGLNGFPIQFSSERGYIPMLSQGHRNGNVIPSLMDDGSFGHSTGEEAYVQMAPQRVASMFQSLGRPSTATPGDTSPKWMP